MGVSGVATFIEATTSSITKLASALLGDREAPKLLQFAIKPAETAYRETTLPLFGAGPETRTYSLDPYTDPRLPRVAVFQVSMENPSDGELLVTGVNYRVTEIGQVKGGEPGPLLSTYTYVHALEHRTGVQRHDLTPPFRIPAKAVGAFELVLLTRHPDFGLAWLMTVEFVTSRGIAATPSFQLILSGRPDWAPSAGR